MDSARRIKPISTLLHGFDLTVDMYTYQYPHLISHQILQCGCNLHLYQLAPISHIFQQIYDSYYYDFYPIMNNPNLLAVDIVPSANPSEAP